MTEYQFLLQTHEAELTNPFTSKKRKAEIEAMLEKAKENEVQPETPD